MIKNIVKATATSLSRSSPMTIVRRQLSLFNTAFIGTTPNKQIEKDLDHAIKLVVRHDPVGYLPGLLVAKEARIGYFAVRAFWIDSGLRFKEDPLSKSISASRQVAGIGQKDIEILDEERLQKWNEGICALYEGKSNIWQNDPTLRLLYHVIEKHSLSKSHFDRILLGREVDVNTNQYTTVEELKDHVEMSCGSLLYLVLECSNIYQNDEENKSIYEAAKHVGITHGLANTLRLSVPKASSTGKIVVPEELCEKYGIKSPRYLLSALGLGDEECKRHLQDAIRDIVHDARNHLGKAREYKDEINCLSNGSKALSTFLPALASETFLNRLERHEYNLTDRKLRNVGVIEHMACASKIVQASFNNIY